MSFYQPEFPPSVSSEDAQIITEWIYRELEQISVVINQNQDIEVQVTPEGKIFDGQLRYFDGTDTTFNQEGLWIKKSGAWAKVTEV